MYIVGGEASSRKPCKLLHDSEYWSISTTFVRDEPRKYLHCLPLITLSFGSRTPQRIRIWSSPTTAQFHTILKTKAAMSSMRYVHLTTDKWFVPNTYHIQIYTNQDRTQAWTSQSNKPVSFFYFIFYCVLRCWILDLCPSCRSTSRVWGLLGKSGISYLSCMSESMHVLRIGFEQLPREVKLNGSLESGIDRTLALLSVLSLQCEWYL